MSKLVHLIEENIKNLANKLLDLGPKLTKVHEENIKNLNLDPLMIEVQVLINLQILGP